MYTFKCVCGYSFDALAGRDASSRPCPLCGESAGRETVYQVNHSGFIVAPVHEREIRMGAFNEATAELTYKHERMVDATQNPDLAPPPLWRMAKAKAKKLERLGVKDSSDVKLTT